MSEQVIDEPFIKKVCSFFMSMSNCRGYDLESSIGRIADRAFKHWIEVRRKEEKIVSLEKIVKDYRYWLDQSESRNKMLKQDNDRCEYKIAKHQKVLNNLYKVKWDETDPLKWNEPKLENKLIHKERVFSAESLREAKDIANHKFGLCSFVLFRYDNELGDFDEEKDLAWVPDEVEDESSLAR